MYLWTQLSGPPLHLSDASAKTISFTLPNVKSNQVTELKVTVTDGILSTSTSTYLTVTDVFPIKKVLASSDGGSADWSIIIILISALGKTRKLNQRS